MSVLPDESLYRRNVGLHHGHSLFSRTLDHLLLVQYALFYYSRHTQRIEAYQWDISESGVSTKLCVLQMKYFLVVLKISPHS